MLFNYGIYMELNMVLRIFTLLIASFSIVAMADVSINPSAESYQKWVTYMASDEMKGRANGSKEIDVVAHWIASQFNNAGLSYPPEMETHLQSFQAKGAIPYRNVIGYLEGSDPAKAHEYIIVSAHYDHIGTSGGLVNNGADDNASGVAALIGVAHQLQKSRPERSMLFIAWSGEEEGFLGSKYYITEPVLPLENAVLNINFEMVGHTKGLGKKQFWLTGAKYSSLYKELKKISDEKDWTVSSSPFPELSLFWRSDNISLALLDVNQETKTAYGIPAHTISTWGREGHYHSPNDDADKIDFENLAQFADTLSYMLIKLSSLPSVVQWHETSDISFKHYKDRPLIDNNR